MTSSSGETVPPWEDDWRRHPSATPRHTAEKITGSRSRLNAPPRIPSARISSKERRSCSRSHAIASLKRLSRRARSHPSRSGPQKRSSPAPKAPKRMSSAPSSLTGGGSARFARRANSLTRGSPRSSIARTPAGGGGVFGRVRRATRRDVAAPPLRPRRWGVKDLRGTRSSYGDWRSRLRRSRNSKESTVTRYRCSDPDVVRRISKKDEP